MTAGNMLIYVLIASLTTFFVRVLPFLVFQGGRPVPHFVSWTGKNLPRAAMAMLVVYCLKDVQFTALPAWLPAILASLVTVVLHVRYRKMVLSICGGTAVYMALLHIL